MKKILFLCLCGLLFTIGNALATAPANLALLKQQIVKYVTSGEYFADIQRQIDSAEIYLQQRIAMNDTSKQKKKLAVVFDIDETAISSYKHMYANDFGAPEQYIYQQDIGTYAQPIPATLELYKFAKQHHIATFFISGRSYLWKKSTSKELNNAGYHNWNHMYLCDTKTIHCPAIPFKSKTRKAITAKGYDIVLNVGDQFSDLKGGYADYMVKLPNPFYYVP